LGRWGIPSEIRNYGTAAIVAGSVGTAMALPTAKALKDSDNHVIFIEGAPQQGDGGLRGRSAGGIARAVHLTDDGTYGEQGLVTDKLKALLADWPQAGLCAGRRSGAHDARRGQSDRAAGNQKPWSA